MENDEARCALAPGLVRSSGGRIRTCDLWVMSPASYRAAPPRVGVPTVHRAPEGAAGPRREQRVTAGGSRDGAVPGDARLPERVLPATYSRDRAGDGGDERVRRRAPTGGHPPPWRLVLRRADRL